MKNQTPRWGEKPYYSLDYYLKQTFGEKIYKVALDGNMTCPNRDGTLDTRGCIFCSAGGSGDFATKRKASITAQIDTAIAFMQSCHKNTGSKYIAYFQSYSNTYGDAASLRSLFTEAINHPDICALSIATRPDCFSQEIYQLLEQLNKIKPVWIELGLQTIHENTAQYIRRGYALSVFEDTVHSLRKLGITVITHVILGLPGETREDVLATIRYLNTMDMQGIKLQLLHVLKGTDLALDYESGLFQTLSEESYIQLLLECVGNLSPDIVIHRLTGDGPKNLLIAPTWSLNKREVLNRISHEMKIQNLYQGKYLIKSEETEVLL